VVNRLRTTSDPSACAHARLNTVAVLKQRMPAKKIGKIALNASPENSRT
jgi:hypothetical protein